MSGAIEGDASPGGAGPIVAQADNFDTTYRVSRLEATMLPMTDARNGDAQLELRASDADRDRTAAALGNAMAAGRLTSAEYAERLDLV